MRNFWMLIRLGYVALAFDEFVVAEDRDLRRLVVHDLRLLGGGFLGRSLGGRFGIEPARRMVARPGNGRSTPRNPDIRVVSAWGTRRTRRRRHRRRRRGGSEWK
ncbi:MAG: hypothetical protein R3F11_18415 [Verrucomicrobiales bacterium]